MTEKIVCDIFGVPPASELSKEDEEKVLQRVKDIISRGNIAVFTRPDRIFESSLVVKRVSKFELNEYGDLLSDNGYVAPWDPKYVITEE